MTGYGRGAVRWDELFADLEAQLAAGEAVALAVEVDQEQRRETGTTTLVQRLRAALGQELVLGVGDQVVRGRLVAVGPDWVLTGGAVQTLVPCAAVGWVQGLGRGADTAPPGHVWSRLGLRSALRGLARDRAAVQMHVAAGPAVSGTIDRVGADHLDLAVHPPDEPRRAAAVTAVRTIALDAVRAVVRADPT